MIISVFQISWLSNFNDIGLFLYKKNKKVTIFKERAKNGWKNTKKIKEESFAQNLNKLKKKGYVLEQWFITFVIHFKTVACAPRTNKLYKKQTRISYFIVL